MFKIGEFAAISGISRKMLRHYEQLGLLKPGQTDRFTGYRYYTLEQLQPIERIHTLREAGFTLREVHDVIERDWNVADFKAMLLQKRRDLSDKQRQIGCYLARLEQQLADIETENTMPEYEIALKPVVDQFLFVDTRAMNVPMRVAVGEPEQLDSLVIQIADEVAPDVFVCTQHRGERKQLNCAFHALVRWIGANEYRVVGPPNIIELPSEQGGESHYCVEIQLPVRIA